MNGTSGFTYLFNFLFSPDYSTMLLLVFLLGFGVMTSGILYKNRLNGFGTLVLQRTSYITYLKKMIAAQALYIISFMLLFYGILIFISITLFGFGLRGQHITGSLTFSDYSIMKSFFFLFIQLLIQIVFVTLAIILSPLTERIISSSYLLMLTPFFYY